MNIIKAYEMLIAGNGGRSAIAGSPSGTPPDMWLSAGIYGAICAVGRLVDRLRGAR